ncbi:unnamed protein product [Thelazia callipaeda]|uniref:Gag protein n=1 Tax=Thelazia callipaeda TaxID=103827 RepID=A0A0N5CJG6_THECL|nr:unnamed protein product [Thelazia callipaeda]
MTAGDHYFKMVKELICEQMKVFEADGGWKVMNENAKHCTYERYLAVGAADCQNSASVIEGVITTLIAVKQAMQKRMETLEVRQCQRSSLLEMTKAVKNSTSRIKNIKIRCDRNVNINDKLVEDDCTNHLSTVLIRNRDLSAPYLQDQEYISKDSMDDTLIQTDQQSPKISVGEYCKPITSLTGSFTVDQDEDTVVFGPVHPLVFEDTETSESILRPKSIMDLINIPNDEIHRKTEPPKLKSEIAKQLMDEVENKNLPHQDAAPEYKSSLPLIKSELAKQWIREVAQEFPK